MGSTFNDGSANAPAGAPELPNLLTGYAARPPWMVAGVDYSVGLPQGLSLKNPSTISMAGVQVDAANHTINVVGNGVTLNGYDFGLNGGWQVNIAAGVTDTTVENSNFLVGSNGLVPIDAPGNAGNLTILNNTFNGGSQTNGAAWAMVSYDGNGTVTAEYNMFENTPADAIDFGHGNMTTIVQFNVFQNLGTEPGSHPDAVQYYGTNSTNSVISFNTITSGEEGIQIDAQGGGSTLLNTTVDNNVVVAQGSGIKISYLIAVMTQGSGTTVNGVQVENNYLDWSAAYGPFYGPDNSSNLVYGNNVDMVTGKAVPNPPGVSDSGSGTGGGGTGGGTGGGGTDDGSGGGGTDDGIGGGGTDGSGQPVGFGLAVNPGSGPSDGAGSDLPPSPTAVADSATTELGGGTGAAGTPPPPGTQLPSLFAGDAVRPPWQVAGVDYAVGLPASTALQNPTGISMNGVTVNATTHVINVTGNGVVLNGYDFSLSGGWRVNVTGHNDVIENSNFKVGTNEQVPITAGSTASNLSVLHNTIDGGGGTGDPSAITSLISDTGTGLTVEYNWLKNAPQTVVAASGGTLNYEFNLIQNVGFGADSTESDLTLSGGVSDGSVISYNTIYNPPHADEPTNLAPGLQIEAQNGATVTNVDVQNNTIISPGPTPTNTYLIAVQQDFGPNILNGVNIQDNFLDPTGASAAYFPTTQATNVAFVDNINLKTGAVVPGIPGTSSTPWGP